MTQNIRSVEIIRYIQPFREGGSLPGLVEANDGFKYVIKFRGAGQGCKALVAELICGELARKAGFKIPELVFAELHEGFGRLEPDEEIQDLLKFSTGQNLGVHFLSGSLTFDAVVNDIDPLLAAKILWFDAWIMNVDRTPRNTNMLIWNKELWLIDHGAALYFHHNWESWREAIYKPFVQIRQHALLPYAKNLEQTDAELKKILTPDIIRSIVDLVPEHWLEEEGYTAQEKKDAYYLFLTERLQNSHHFIQAAYDAQK